jgi:hypothetical protein
MSQIAGFHKKLTPEQPGHKSRNTRQAIKKQTETSTHSIKESTAMQIARIYMQDDVTRHLFHFLTTKDIPVHNERNMTVLISNRLTQAC